jgi:hypothetical protein
LDFVAPGFSPAFGFGMSMSTISKRCFFVVDFYKKRSNRDSVFVEAQHAAPAINAWQS